MSDVEKVDTPQVPQRHATYIDPGIMEDIVNCIKANVGRPPKLCAAKYGVTVHAYNKLMAKGADPDCDNPLARRFFIDVSRAAADSQLGLLDTIATHAEADWRAADRLLQIANPEMDPKRKSDSGASSAVNQGTTNNHLTINVNDLSSLLGLITEYVKPASLSSGDYIDVEEELEDE